MARLLALALALALAPAQVLAPDQVQVQAMAARRPATPRCLTSSRSL